MDTLISDMFLSEERYPTCSNGVEDEFDDT